MVTGGGRVSHAEKRSSKFKIQSSKNDPIRDFQGKNPLIGKRILITRPRTAANNLAIKLKRLDAVPIVCPLLRVVIPRENSALDAAASDVAAYNWLAFTSAHGVKAFWRRLVACGLDARRLSGCKLAALGFATARQLSRYGLKADVSARSAEEMAAEIISKSRGSF
jgi:uroporphyrinogen III methyltransferase/synthase